MPYAAQMMTCSRPREALKGAERRVRLLNAAEILSEIQSRKLEVSALTDAIDKANGEIAPIRIECRQRGALYREGLVRARQGELNSEATCKQEADGLTKQLVQLAEDEKTVLRQKESAQTDRIRAEASLPNLRCGVRPSSATTVSGPGEAVDAALVRLQEGKDQYEQVAIEFDAAAVAADEAVRLYAERTATLSTSKAKAESAAERFEEEMEEGLEQQNALRANQSICRAISADSADPDSEVLGALLDGHIQRLQADATQAELDYARLDEDAQSIRDTGLAGRDAEVIKVVRALANSGIKNTQAYAQYLAAVFPDGDAARSLVQSDPARFLGVAVPTREQLDLVKALIPALPELTRPVVVSLVTDKPSKGNDECIVLSPAEDSLFNLKAAARKGERTEQELIAQADSRSEARKLLTEAQRRQDSAQQLFEGFWPSKD
ncbi:hypothetical protein ACTMU2_18000 [Cupriavidus basilensis]